jgi:hypothetical protein
MGGGERFIPFDLPQRGREAERQRGREAERQRGREAEDAELYCCKIKRGSVVECGDRGGKAQACPIGPAFEGRLSYTRIRAHSGKKLSAFNSPGKTAPL